MLNWSQSDLARRAGTSRRSIYTIESSAGPVERETAAALVAAFEAAGIEFSVTADRLSVSGRAGSETPVVSDDPKG